MKGVSYLKFLILLLDTLCSSSGPGRNRPYYQKSFQYYSMRLHNLGVSFPKLVIELPGTLCSS